MKGVFFQKPAEFTLHVEGESWRQGDELVGRLEVKNHGSSPLPTDGIAVQLADGSLKQVRAKNPDAFEILESRPMQAGGTIAPQGGRAEFTWKFSLDRNFAITDVSSSPFLLYGAGTATEKLGQLQLSIGPEPVIEEFLNRFKITYRFVEKTRKSLKDGVDVKLDPPDSKQFSMLEYVNVRFAFDGEALEVRYHFNVTQIEATIAGTQTKKEKRIVDQRLEPTDYRVASGRFNQDTMDKLIGAAIEAATGKAIP